MKQMMTVGEVATHMNVSNKTVYRAIKSGSLIAHRVGGRLRISAAALASYLAARCTTPDAELGDDG